MAGQKAKLTAEMADRWETMRASKMANHWAGQKAKLTASNWARPRAKQRAKMTALHLVPMKEKH